MNFHNIIFNVLWKHLEKFEMDITNMEYPQTHLNVCNICFCQLMDSLKTFKKTSMTYLWDLKKTIMYNNIM